MDSAPRIDSMENNALTFSLEIEHILLYSRKMATQEFFQAKWKSFNTYAKDHHLDPCRAPLDSILSYMVSLRDSGLGFSKFTFLLS